MADLDKNKKIAKELNKDLSVIENTIISIANNLSNAVKNALEDVKDESKQVSEIFAGDIVRGIKGLAKGLDDTIKNQQKLISGQLKSSDIAKQIEDRAIKREIIERTINSLSAEQNGLKDTLNRQLAELDEAEAAHLAILRQQQSEAEALEKKMGAIGAIVKGISKIPIIGDLINADEIMGKIQQKAARTGGAFAKLEVAAYGVGQVLGSALDAMTDPTIVFAKILKSAGEIEKQQKVFRSITGQNIDLTDTLNTGLITTGEYIKSASMLSKELGINAAVVFSPETINEVAQLTENMGLGAHEAAQLAKFAKLSGKPLAEVSANMESSFRDFVGTEKVGINFKGVMEDVGSVSAAVSLSMGSSADNIQDAAMEARKLGLSLQQVDDIAGSILQFESSIQAEMEAELLTGKQLNLDKARQLALANDLEGLSKEIGKNEGILKAFASGNRIQQEATAKAMGMSREEMSKMIYAQKIQGDLSTEQAAKAAGISLEEAKRLGLQQQIEKSINKITEALAGPLTYILQFVSNGLVLKGIMAAIAISLVKKSAPALKSMAMNMFKVAAGALQYFKNLKQGQGIMGSLKGLTGGDKTGDVTDKLTKSSKNLKPGAGKIMQGFLTGLGKGLAALGKALKGPQLAYIAIGVGLISVAMIALGAALGLAAPGIKAFGTVITAVFDGIGTIITKTAEGFVLIMEAVSMENIGPMLLLGPALFGIAGGLMAVALAGIGALPILGALSALGLVSAPLIELAGVFGAGGGEDNNNESQLLKKLDELIAVVTEGGDVYMDGNKVGKSLTIASSGIG